MAEPKSVDPLQEQLLHLLDEKRKVETNLHNSGDLGIQRLIALQHEIVTIRSVLGAPHV